MLFFKKMKKKLTGKWYPQLVLVGKPADTQEVAERIARESTVSPADSHAVIRALPEIMADIMAEGRAVHLDGFGSFYFTCQATGKGVDTAEKVSSNQITSVRVQFIPYREREGTVYTRAMVSNLSFTEWLGKDPNTKPGGNTGGSDGDENDNPLG